jgi:Ca2+-binding RTX toxin-like protein
MRGIRLLSVGGSLAMGLAMAAMLASTSAAADPCDAPGTIVGTPGDDRLKGSRGDDTIDGLGGDDVIRGHRGADLLCGGDGGDTLSGDQGDDVLDGGPGVDLLRGGRGSNELVDGAGTLSAAIDTGSRAEVTGWLGAHDIASIDGAVAGLTAWRLDELPALLLDSNAAGDARDKLLRVMRTVLGTPDRGFYAEIWGYTRIELTPGGFFGG